MVPKSRAMLTGLGIGVGLMYFMDPERGRRRRALVRDKMTHTTRASVNAMGSFSRDLTHRAKGVLARARGAIRRNPIVDDEVLAERVRSRLGRVVSHPRAIEVNATRGWVGLRGPILQSEIQRLMRTVSRIPGVRGVVSSLNGIGSWQPR